MDCFSLSRLHTYIRRVISLNFPEPVWVRAEILNVVSKSGHYFLELAEKSPSDEILAQSSAVLWKNQAADVSKNLGTTVSGILKTGNEIMFKAQVDFHVRYGLKLQLLELNKEFTLGLMAINKQKVIQRLQQEGLWQKNKTCELPLHLKNIAIIASKSSAAFADFTHQLNNNVYGYKYGIKCFDVAVQGQFAVSSICEAFHKLQCGKKFYDLIVLIRGGGSRHDLSDFDQFEISKAVSQCQIPVLTGIGHQTDESVTDLSAFKSLKTPTAVAEFIVHHTLNLEEQTELIAQFIFQNSFERLQRLRTNLQYFQSDLQYSAKQHVSAELLNAMRFEHKLREITKDLYVKTKEKHAALLAFLVANDPVEILNKGYSISTIQGKSLHHLSKIESGQELTTRYNSGILKSKITDVWRKEN